MPFSLNERIKSVITFNSWWQLWSIRAAVGTTSLSAWRGSSPSLTAPCPPTPPSIRSSAPWLRDTSAQRGASLPGSATSPPPSFPPPEGCGRLWRRRQNILYIYSLSYFLFSPLHHCIKSCNLFFFVFNLHSESCDRKIHFSISYFFYKLTVRGLLSLSGVKCFQK